MSKTSFYSTASNVVKEAAQSKIHEIEKAISKLSAERNCQIVKTYIKGLGTSEGNFSQIGMWKLKNKLMPKEMDPPMAKVDKLGNLITAPEALKNLYLQTYVERLRHREIKDDYISNYQKKIE